MTHDPREVHDTSGNIVSVSRFGDQVHVRREAISGGDDWIELRFPASAATNLAFQLLTLAAASKGHSPTNPVEDADG